MPVVVTVCDPKSGLIFVPAIAALAFTSALTISSEASFVLAIAADALISALTIAPDVTSVPFASGTVSVLVVLVEIFETLNANCFVVSLLSNILDPFAFAITAAEVMELIPVKVVRLLPRATAELPIVTVLLAKITVSN